MASFSYQLFRLYAITMMIGTHSARVRMDKQHSGTESLHNMCGEVVPGSVSRECANRMYLVDTCSKNNVCKCPIYAKLAGDDPACDPSKYVDGRKFDPQHLDGKGCTCATPSWVPTERKVVTWKCPVESYFKTIRPELDDFAATAHKWCNSKLVPEEKLIPKSMRGVYWMKGGNPHDVAFCTTRADFDKETLTAKLSPWTDFVWRKRDNEDVPHFLNQMAVKNLVYKMKFKDDSMTYANITVNNGLANALINFPLIEVEETDDGSVTAQKKGDLFARPSSVMGMKIAKYWAVRIVDDEGNVNPEWYKMMAEAEHVVNTTTSWWGNQVTEVKTSFVRYEQDCSSNNERPIFGGKKDEHGCLPSAGYTWCESKQECLRSHECEERPIFGGKKDEHGCLPSAGYTWCESKQECLRSYECEEGRM